MSEVRAADSYSSEPCNPDQDAQVERSKVAQEERFIRDVHFVELQNNSVERNL